MFELQKPLQWAFNALGIISGGAPQTMWKELTPTIELMQGGWGQARFFSFSYITALGVPTDCQPLADNGFNNATLVNQRYQFLIRASYVNNDSVSHTWGIKTFPAGGGAFFVDHVVRNTSAGNTDGWNELGYPSSWVHVVPGTDVILRIPGHTTSNGQISYELAAFPAGSNPGR